MIAQLQGQLLHKSPTRVLLDVNGVGYEILVPLSTFEKLGEVGDRVSVLTHLHVREDALQLFGFATQDEKQLFQLLIAVSGIGPKVAQGILSGCSVDTFCQYIQQNQIAALTAIPGIGRKTAERLVIELRDRLAPFAPSSERQAAEPAPSDSSRQALMALVSLGYSRAAAEKAVHRVAAENGELAVEELIKRSLRYI